MNERMNGVLMSRPGAMYVRESTGIITDDLQSVWGEALEPHRPPAVASRFLHRSFIVPTYMHTYIICLSSNRS